MASLLYLDTARLGRMTPHAQLAHTDFVRFAGEEGCPLYFEDFLKHGRTALPRKISSRFPGLAQWEGVGNLKRRLRSLAGLSFDLPMLISNRSSQLMTFAANLLCRPSDRILTCDLAWPTYMDILRRACIEAGCELIVLPIRETLLTKKSTAEEVVIAFQSAFRSCNCDALFIPAVSHDGIRLPVERIAAAIESENDSPLVVVDGAQDFCHAPSPLSAEHCDLYLASCHKWLGAYYPMGLAFFGKRRSASLIETTARRLLARGEVDDPLLRFSTQLETDSLDATTETVSIASLFSCLGATNDAEINQLSCFEQRRRNVAQIEAIASSSGWEPLKPSEELESGILLLQGPATIREATPQAVRQQFQENGVALTAYEQGVVRVSMPATPLQQPDLNRLQAALRAIA